MKFGLIAGNGRFPFLVAEGARRAGASLAVVAIREEADPEIEQLADIVQWVGIGQLGKMISFFKSEGVSKAMMAGQVKHVQIFSGALPDLRMIKMLWSLPQRNTDALIGGVADEIDCLLDAAHFYYVSGQGFGAIDPAGEAVRLADVASLRPLQRNALTLLGVCQADTGNISAAVEFRPRRLIYRGSLVTRPQSALSGST